MLYLSIILIRRERRKKRIVFLIESVSEEDLKSVCMIETNNQQPHLPSKTAAALKDLMNTQKYTL